MRCTTRARFRRCSRGLRLSKLFGRDGVITFESNGAFVARARQRPAAAGASRASATSAATRRCIATSLASIRERHAARDEPRARDRRSAADGPRSTRALDNVNAHFDIVIIGSGAGGGTMAHALAPTRRAHPDPRARRLRPAGRPRTGDPAAVWKDLRYRTHGAVARRARRASSARTRTTTSAATRSSGAACSTGCGARTSRRSSTSTASRRPGRSTTTRSRRTTIGPSGCTRCTARPASIRRSRRAARIPYPPVPHAPGMARHRRRGCGEQGLHPSPLPLGLLRPRASRAAASSATPATRSPCRIHAKSDADVCGVAPGARRTRTSRCGPNARAARLITDASRHAGSRRSRSSATARSIRVDGAARHRLVRRGQLGGAAAAVGDGRASRRPGQFLRPGRPPLHGAPGDDDARAFHPLRKNADGVPEDGGDQRLLPARRRHAPYPLGQIQSQGRTHGVMAQTVALGRGFRSGRTTRGCRAASTGWRCPRTCRDPDNRVTRRRPTAASALRLPAEQPRGARAAGRARRKRILQRLGFWIVDDATRTAAQNTTHQCGTLCFGTDPRASVLDPFCRDARRRESVRRRRVVLPVVGGREPGTDDRRAGAAGRRSHQATISQELRESALVQPRRHHRVGLQPGGAGSTGTCSAVRSSASPTRRPIACAAFFGVDAPAPTCKIGWIRVPGGAMLEIFEFQPQQPPAADLRGTASA